MSNLFQLIFIVIFAYAKLRKPGGGKVLIAENLCLRQQLMVLTKKNKRCPNLSHLERFAFATCSLFLSVKRLSRLAILLKPKTILDIHDAFVKRKYSNLFGLKNKKKPGPRGPSQELIALVLEYKKLNPRFGYLRIAMQISNQFGIKLDDDVVRRIINKYYKPNPDDYKGPSWLTTLGHSVDSLWSMDLFRAESINLKTHWILVVMDQYTRRIIGFAVHCGDVDGLTLCLMFNKIISNKSLPNRLSTDNDPLFKFYQWQSNLRVLEIDEIKSVPYTPTSHPFVERLIRSIREDLLNHTFFWNKFDLQKKLDSYQEYFNHNRAHFGIDEKTPINKCGEKQKIIDIKNYRWKKHLSGLVQLPEAS